MKKAFIIGYHIYSKGVFSKHLKRYEWDFYMDIIHELGKIGDVFIHNEDIKSYTNRVKNTASEINKKDYDLVMALHFNSFDGTAQGCESLYYHTNEEGKKYSEKFCNIFTSKTGISNRGAKPLDSPRDRGFGELAYTKATTILLEPFFGGFKQDCDNFSAEEFLTTLKEL
jgi:N-acetylmuramoyl-L-alanine amidase